MAGTMLISTSPRSNGNSDDAASIVLDGLGRAASLICLHDPTIERCQGCLNCQKGKQCAIKDDFPELWRRVKDADTLVYFVPVYWCSPPGIMKDFIDRTVVDYGTGAMTGKAVHLVSIAQAAGFDPQEKIIEQWTSWLGGTSLKTKMRLIAFHTGELKANTSAVSKLKKLAASL